MCSSAASRPSRQQTDSKLMPVSSMISKHCDSLRRQLTATEHPKIQMGTRNHVSKCKQGREIKRLTFFFMAVLGITSLQRQQHCYTAPAPAHRPHTSLKLLSAPSSVQTGTSRPAAARPGADSRCSMLRGRRGSSPSAAPSHARDERHPRDRRPKQGNRKRSPHSPAPAQPGRGHR